MAYPAQPAQPAQPIQPGMHPTGGYTGPGPSAPSVMPPLPGAGPMSGPQSIEPSPMPGQYTTPPPTETAVSPAPAATGLPPAVTGLGIDQKAYDQIISELGESADPELFKTQFGHMMEQRNLLATPKGVDESGYQQISREQENYFGKFIREAVAYGSAPQEFGGLGYTEGQAKMMAVIEAKRRWPEVPSYTWSTLLPGGELEAAELGHARLEKGSAPIEVGPRRATRLDPTKIADILTKPEFKKALDEAKTYKEKVGTAANAVDFLKDVYNTHVGRVKTAQEKARQAFTLAQDDYAKYVEDAVTQAESLAGEEERAAYQTQANQVAKEKRAQIEALEKRAKTKIPEEDILQWITDSADIYSVAAALQNLY